MFFFFRIKFSIEWYINLSKIKIKKKKSPFDVIKKASTKNLANVQIPQGQLFCFRTVQITNFL